MVSSDCVEKGLTGKLRLTAVISKFGKLSLDAGGKCSFGVCGKLNLYVDGKSFNT